MWNFTRKRQTAGNICLVLFTAFLFTILVTPFTMVGNAEAAQGTAGGNTITSVELSGSNYIQGGASLSVTGTTSGYQLLVKLAGSPLSSFETLRVDFVNSNGAVLSVYGNDASKATYISNSVYGAVYSFAYLATSDFYLAGNNQVTGKVYSGTTYLFSVALTLNPPYDNSVDGDDDDTTPPPPPPAAEEEEDDTTETDTSNITTETETDNSGQTVVVAKVEVKDDDVMAQMDNDAATTTGGTKEITIEATTTAGAAKTNVSMGAAVLEKAAATNTTVTIKTDLTQVKLAPTSVDSKGTAAAMAASVATSEETKKVINQVKSGTAPAAQTAAQKAAAKLVEQLTTGQTAAEAEANAEQVAEAVKEVADKVAKGEGKVKLSTATVSASEAQVAEALGNSDNANIKAVGVVLDLKLEVEVKLDKSVNGVDSVSMPVTEFKEPVTVSLDPPAEWTPGTEVFLFKIEGGKVIKNLKGTYNPETGKLDFSMTDWSYWTMAIKAWAFADIIDHWAIADIEALAGSGIVKGVTDNKFAPDATVTRAEFATMLVKALGLFEVEPFVATFKDVKATDWYYTMVETAARNGLVAGAHGNFNPNAKISRQEMAAMINNALKIEGKASAVSSSDAAGLLSKFSDQKQIADWAKNSVAAAVKDGIIVGRTADTFVPTANATRAEGSVMINKVLKKIQ